MQGHQRGLREVADPKGHCSPKHASQRCQDGPSDPQKLESEHRLVPKGLSKWDRESLIAVFKDQTAEPRE